MKYSLLLVFFVFFGFRSFGQIDLQCHGRDQHAIYFLDQELQSVYRIDSVDTNPAEPVLVSTYPILTGGLSINKDLNTGSGDTIMYACSVGGVYYYNDNTAWLTDYTTSASETAVNFGGNDQYLYNLDGFGYVMRTDGINNSTVLVGGLAPTQFIADIAVDMNGNFYLLSTQSNKLLVYSIDGTLLQTIPVSTEQVNSYYAFGGGFAILGSKMYYIDISAPYQHIYEGAMQNDSLHFSIIDSLDTQFYAADIAACPNVAQPLSVFSNHDSPRFAIFPNPAENEVTIDLNNTEAIRISDFNGRLMLNTKTQGMTQYRISVSDYAAGIYIVTATSPSGIETYKKLMVR